jgi:hypothetical protein
LRFISSSNLLNSVKMYGREFLNSLEGEIVAIIPNVTPVPATFVDFLLIVEKLG